MAANSGQALGDLQNFQKTMQSGTSLLNTQEQKLGIPQAQSQVSGLRQAITNTTNLLNQIPSSVYGRTADSLVTSGQAGRQIQNESAPVMTKLQGQNQQYGQQETDLQRLIDKAGTNAQLSLSDQQNRLGALQNIYQNLFGREQAAQAQRLEQQKLQEQIREANMADTRARQAASSNNGIDLGSLFGGASGGGTVSQGPQMQQRKGGGFNFQDESGKALNAVGFAHAKSIPVRTLLSQMAKSGDRGAKTALQYVGNDYGVNLGKLSNLRGGVGSANYRNATNLLRALGFRI